MPPIFGCSSLQLLFGIKRTCDNLFTKFALSMNLAPLCSFDLKYNIFALGPDGRRLSILQSCLTACSIFATDIYDPMNGIKNASRKFPKVFFVWVLDVYHCQQDHDHDHTSIATVVFNFCFIKNPQQLMFGAGPRYDHVIGF